MADYASVYVNAKMREVATHINARMREISDQTGISFGTFFASALGETSGASAQSVDALSLSQLLSQNADQSALTDLKLKALPDAAKAVADGSGQGRRETGADAYGALIETVSARYGVAPALIEAVVYAESNFDPDCLSRSGAMGLMQLMPSTAEGLGVEDAFDPEQNVDAGVRYLRNNLEYFDGDVRLALAAYNCGVSGVTRRGVTDLDDAAQWLLLPSETQQYLRNIERYLIRSGAEGLLLEPMRP